MSDATWACVLSFPDQSPAFAHGVEAGMWWERCQRDDMPTEGATVHADNQIVLHRMAQYHGLVVTFTTLEGFGEWMMMHRRTEGA